MPKNPLIFGLPGAVPPSTSDSASRLSYPMLMALMGASQGANNTGSDWVDLGSGFKAYDSSPKRALMGLIQGGSQGYMQGMMQQQQAQAQQAAEEAKRNVDMAEWQKKLGLTNDAEVAKTKEIEGIKLAMQLDPRRADMEAQKEGYAGAQDMIQKKTVERETERKLKQNKDWRETYEMQDKRDSESAKLALEQDRFNLLREEADRKAPLIEAQTEATKALATQRLTPKEMAVAKAKALAISDTARMFPNIPEAMVEFDANASKYKRAREAFYLGALSPSDNSAPANPTAQTGTAPISSLFK